MITDQETNFVFFSELLPQRHPVFFKELAARLKQRQIGCGLLPCTKDIWCRDYMPIQISKNRFVQFKYDPAYLRHSRKDKATITDTANVCKAIGIRPVMSDIRLDGGNVVKSKAMVIMTERVYSENPTYSRTKLIKELKELFAVDQLVIVPQDPADLFGHADGMVRFHPDAAHNNVVFVNDYSSEPIFKNELNKILNKAGVRVQPVSYNPYSNKKKLDACGVYINYLQIGKTIIYPVYGIEEDKLVREMFSYCSGRNAIPIRSNEIAKEGGVLNCISWNIFN